MWGEGGVWDEVCVWGGMWGCMCVWVDGGSVCMISDLYHKLAKSYNLKPRLLVAFSMEKLLHAMGKSWEDWE